MTICPLCNKDFKLLTANHISHKHHITVANLKYLNPDAYKIIYKDLQRLHKLGRIGRKNAWTNIVQKNRIMRNCLNCKKNIHCRINSTTKFCCLNCAKQYFKFNNIGLYSHENRLRGSQNSIKKQRKLKIGWFNPIWQENNIKNMKKNNLGFYNKDIQIAGGRIGGKVTQSRYDCQKWLNTPKARQKLNNSMKRLWDDPIFKKNRLIKMLSSLKNRPTGLEKKVIKVINEHNLKFEYTGDGKVLINYKNPDFIDNKHKLIIEVFYEYFKIKTYGSVKNYMQLRSKLFFDKKYRTIFITNTDTKRPNWEKILVNKINKIKKNKRIIYISMQ